jgi:hypothetical protein
MDGHVPTQRAEVPMRLVSRGDQRVGLRTKVIFAVSR